MLEALGSTSLNLLLNVGFNQEVGLDSCIYWGKEKNNLKHLIEHVETFDQDYIDTAKLMIKNSMKKTNDEPLSQVAVQYNRDITEKKETNEQYLEKIENVTYQDIVDVCQNIELDTIFLLKGRNE